MNIKDYPETLTAQGSDWLLIQRNLAIPAYERIKVSNFLANIGGSDSNWIFIDGSAPYRAFPGEKLIIQAPSNWVLDFPVDPIFGDSISIFLISSSLSPALDIDTEGFKFDSKATPLGITFKKAYLQVDFIYINSVIGWITSVPQTADPKGVDPFFNNVKLLLHGNGENDGSVFVDVKGNTLAPVGNIKTKTNTFKFPTASIYTNGTSAYLSAPNAPFSFTNQDFTIEFFYKDDGTVNGSARIVQQCAGDVVGGYEIFFTNSNTLALRLSSTNSGFTITGGTIIGTVSTTEFNHYAVSRVGNNIRLFKNLSLVETIVNANPLYAGAGTFALMGQPGVNRSPKGYLEEFRLTVGTGRYTTNQAPLTDPFSDF